MKKEARGAQYVRRSILSVGVLLPTLSLVPFGSFWLWQNGLLLYWGLAAVATTAAAFAFQHWLLRPVASASPEKAQIAPPDGGEGLAWSPREAAAWEDVLAIAEGAGLDQLTSRDAALALGQKTVEAVARRFHPDVDDPFWRFTVPEALALVEQVSARLRPFVQNSIPLGDRLTVGQAIQFYRWSGFIDSANKAYDIWRIVRLVNPLGAAMSEAREKISKKMYEWGRDELARRLARAYVKEVGRAAIDLYGGRLRVSKEDLASAVSQATLTERAAENPAAGEPLRILLGGQTGAGKSSLVNALAKETVAAVDALPTTRDFQAHALSIAGAASAVIVDSPPMGEPGPRRDAYLEAAGNSDLILWTVSAARADRDADKQALGAMRASFAARLDRRPPPILAAATHIDRLRPFQEWAPPYDLRDASNAKAASIRDAIEAIAADLGLETDDIVPVSLDSPGGAYNIEALWAKILDKTPEAQRARLVRVFSELRSRSDWRAVLTQAGNAGRLLVKSLTWK